MTDYIEPTCGPLPDEDAPADALDPAAVIAALLDAAEESLRQGYRTLRHKRMPVTAADRFVADVLTKSPGEVLDRWQPSTLSPAVRAEMRHIEEKRAHSEQARRDLEDAAFELARSIR